MSKDEADHPKQREYDLEERTAQFREAILKLAKQIPVNAVTRKVIEQLVAAGTSVGANYCEADDSGTRKDFYYRIGICKREARETRHWLRMLTTAIPEVTDEAKQLQQEAGELNRIFAAIHQKRSRA